MDPGIAFLDDWSYFDSKEEEEFGWLSLLGRVGLFRKTQWTVHYRMNWAVTGLLLAVPLDRSFI